MYEPLPDLDLPHGPPLHLERPGRTTALLAPFLRPQRLARFREVLAARTRHLAGLLEHVHDPHNIAACVRSCDAFGLQDLHVVPQAGAPPRLSGAVAGGSHRRVNVRTHEDAEAAVDALRRAGYRLAVTDLGGRGPIETLEEVACDGPLCVAFGNERDGISPALRAHADVRVRIPMRGFVTSFNISVAFALTTYTLRRRMDALPAARLALPGDYAARILDRWVLSDMPQARAVVAELVRRAEHE